VQLQQQIRHLKRLSSTPGLTIEQAQALAERRDDLEYYKNRLKTLANIKDPRLPDTSHIPPCLKAQWKNAENGRPVAKWVDLWKEEVKLDAHERLKQQKKEITARNRRFHQGPESKELQRRRSPGYFTSRGYWHTDCIFPGLPKRYQQHTPDTLMLGCQVRDNWVSGERIKNIPRPVGRHPATSQCLVESNIQPNTNGPVELAALHCLLIIHCPAASRNFLHGTVTKYEAYIPTDLIHQIWCLLDIDSLVESQMRTWDRIDHDILPEEEEPIDRQQPFEQFIEPDWLPDPPQTEEDREVAQWGQWGYDQPRRQPTGV